MGLLDKIKTLVSKEESEQEKPEPRHGEAIAPADIDDPPYTFRTALLAASQGDLAKIREHLEHEPLFAKCQDWDDNTLLHRAAHYAQAEVVQALLESGAAINALYKDKTPLHFAVSADPMWVKAKKKIEFAEHLKQMRATVEVLLEHGAEIDVTDDKGETSLHAAVRSGYPIIAQMLIDHGASVDMLTSSGHGHIGDATEGRTPLLLAARFSKSRKIIEFLLSKGANSNAQDVVPGFTPLHYIAQTPYQQDPNKEQQLGEAAEALLRYKADPSIRSIKKGQQTPLHLAAANNHVAVAEALLAHGADVHAKAAKDMMPMGVAASEGSMEMVDCLLKHGVDPYKSRAMFFASYCKNSTTAIELLIKRGVDINQPDEQGVTPIFAAVSVNSFRNVKFLLEHGADTSLHPPGRTLIQHAYANWGAVEALPEEQKKLHADDARKIIEILGGFE